VKLRDVLDLVVDRNDNRQHETGPSAARSGAVYGRYRRRLKGTLLTTRVSPDSSQ
jgi:hypothetical protein